MEREENAARNGGLLQTKQQGEGNQKDREREIRGKLEGDCERIQEREIKAFLYQFNMNLPSSIVVYI